MVYPFLRRVQRIIAPNPSRWVRSYSQLNTCGLFRGGGWARSHRKGTPGSPTTPATRGREEHENLAERMLVTLQGMRTLRAFGQEQRYQHTFERASAEVRRASMAFERLNALVSPAVQIGYLILLTAIIVVSGPMGVSFVAILAFVALVYRLQPHVHELERNLIHAAQLEASARSVMGVLDRSGKTYLSAGATPFTGLRKEIRFESVSFSYTGARSPSLNQISFTIPAGATTALVGMSGAGKTTIVNLLIRLYREDSGSILVDESASTNLPGRAGFPE